MQIKEITDVKVKSKLMSLVMEVAALQMGITDNIFKSSQTEGEIIHKLELFRDKMTELAEDIAWQKRKN